MRDSCRRLRGSKGLAFDFFRRRRGKTGAAPPASTLPEQALWSQMLRFHLPLARLFATLALAGAQFGFAQVSPAEILNPRLKAAEEALLPQLVDLNGKITRTKFPFPFVLSRYLGLDPKEQLAADRRGLEFVVFHDRVILKISGDYNAAFNSNLLTENQRANRVFDEVVAPILGFLPQYFSPASHFDGFGFEIAYHVRTKRSSYDYEGQEVLTLALDKADAFGCLNARHPSERQEFLNRSLIYVNGKELGLALGAKDPLDLETLERPQWTRAVEPAKNEPTPPRAAGANTASPESSPLPAPRPADRPSHVTTTAPKPASTATNAEKVEVSVLTPGPPSAEVDALQKTYQPQLDALNKQGIAHFHFVNYSPASFVIFRNQIYLQMTLRNPGAFDRNATSIYKRAAQSFDLFLAPMLKPLLDQVPRSQQIAGLDITVINPFATPASPASEAVEFVCPLGRLQQFVGAEITNQDLINESFVFVNGVRITLSLQQVE